MFEQEEFLTIQQAAKRLPTRPHVSTIFRWISRGVRHQKLATVVVGGRRYIPMKALEDFIAALNAMPKAAGNLPATGKSRLNRIEKASRELRRDGF